MEETFDEFICRQIDFIPVLVKFLFANINNNLTILAKDGIVYTVYVDDKGHFRRRGQKNGKPVDEPISFTIDDAIAVSSQLEVSPSNYPDEYANKKEEIKAIVKEYYGDGDNDDVATDTVM